MPGLTLIRQAKGVEAGPMKKYGVGTCHRVRTNMIGVQKAWNQLFLGRADVLCFALNTGIAGMGLSGSFLSSLLLPVPSTA